MLALHQEGFLTEDEVEELLPGHEIYTGPASRFIEIEKETGTYRILAAPPALPEWLDIICEYYAFPASDTPKKILSALEMIVSRNMYTGPLSLHSRYYMTVVAKLQTIHRDIEALGRDLDVSRLKGPGIATLPFLAGDTLEESYHQLDMFLSCILEHVDQASDIYRGMKRMRAKAKQAERCCSRSPWR
jgi:hypothetical protein